MAGLFVLAAQPGATLEETRNKYALSELQAQAILEMRLAAPHRYGASEDY